MTQLISQLLKKSVNKKRKRTSDDDVRLADAKSATYRSTVICNLKAKTNIKYINMKKVSSEQITDTAIVYTVIDYTETIEWMYQEFSKLVDNEIIPIMEKDEELNEKYINPTEGNKRELFPIVGYFEGVT